MSEKSSNHVMSDLELEATIFGLGVQSETTREIASRLLTLWTTREANITPYGIVLVVKNQETSLHW